jgi:hypothetical protein
MTIFKSLPLIASLAVLFLSCKKDDAANNPSNPSIVSDTCKATRIIFTPQFGGGAYGYIDCNITYTGNNITQITYPANGSIVFSYDSLNNLKRKVYYFYGSPQVQESHTYISNWNIPSPYPHYIQSIDSNYYSGAFHSTGYTIFSYGSTLADSTILTGITSTNPNVTFKNITFTWRNGDPIAFKFVEPNTSQVQTDSIYYDTTKINKFNQLFPKFALQGIGNSGELFDGYSKYMLYHFISKHMITRITTTGSAYYKILGDFTYTYNADNLVKEVKQNGITILQYFYSCD